jgi:hypothetical protein
MFLAFRKLHQSASLFFLATLVCWGQEAGAAPGTRLQFSIKGNRYCEGDSLFATLHVQCHLKFINRTPRPMIIYAGTDTPLRSVLTPMENGVPDAAKKFELTNTIIREGGVPPSADRPTAPFKVLAPRHAFETVRLLSIPIKINASEGGASAPSAGTYLLRIVVESFPYGFEVGTELRQRWSLWGDLLLDNIESEPTRLVIQTNPQYRRCD